jgi:hypothetical protein
MQMIRQRHLIRGTVALAAALTAVVAPAALADPAPLANTATIAANGQSSPAVQPNPDEQTATGATANPGPCSEVCSGGAASYGSATTTSTPPALVRVVTRDGGFRWGDAGIGAGGILALTLDRIWRSHHPDPPPSHPRRGRALTGKLAPGRPFA